MPEATAPAEARSNRALDLLHENVTQLLDSETWAKALKLRSKLHRYSVNNLFLIALQAPDATMIAGYNRWQDLGRQVRKGEKSIAILAPIVRKRVDDAGEETKAVVGFRGASVFDVAQTDGEPLPTPPAPILLTGSQDAAEAVWANLSTYAASIGALVSLVPSEELCGAMGSYTRGSCEIKVRDDVEPLQRVKTGIHELAHHVLHGKSEQLPETHVRELEAETAAFLVADALGLDTSSYSFHYLAHWAAEDPKALMATGNRAIAASDAILQALGVDTATAS